MSKTPLILAVVSIVIISCLTFALDKSDALRKRLEADNEQKTHTIALQNKMIVDKSLQFQRFNQIASSASSNGLHQRAASEERKIEYKAIIQKDPTCDLPVPRGIADRLLNNTYRLRGIAMRIDAQNADPADPAITAGRALTYCDLPVWVDALLTDIEQANTQLMAIEQAEDERQNEKTQQH